MLGALGLSLLAVVAVSKIRSELFQSGQGRAFLETQRAATAAARPRLPVAPVEPPPRPEPAAAPGRAPTGQGSSALARIEIPRVGVSAIVVEGDDDATLALAVARALRAAISCSNTLACRANC